MDIYVVAIAQALGQGVFGVADAEVGDREGVGKLLCMVVQVVQVVLAGVEEVADLVVRHG